MREWFKLGLTAHKHRLTEAKAIGIKTVSILERKLSDTEWLVVTGLSQAEYDYNTMLVHYAWQRASHSVKCYSPGHRRLATASRLVVQ